MKPLQYMYIVIWYRLELMLARDKALSKKILKYHRIPTPDFYVFRKNKKVKVPANVKYPLFVKTLNTV